MPPVVGNVSGFMGLAASYILSVQQVSITIPAGSTSNTATINAVGSTAYLEYQGQTNTNSTTTSDFPKLWARATLTNSTTITATRNTSDASMSTTINVVVVELSSDVVESVQFGTISLPNQNSGTAAITSVDTSRSAVFYLGHTQTFDTLGNISVTLEAATSVEANSRTVMTGVVSFCVVQFKAAVIQSLQQIATTFSGASSTDVETITSVNTSNSMIAYGGDTFNNSYQGWHWTTLTNSTTVTHTRYGSNTATRTIYYTVIEFVPGILRSSQRGSISISSSTTGTATLSSVNTAKSIVRHLGLSTAGSSVTPANGDQPDAVFSRLSLTNATTITATTGQTQIEDVGYEVTEFN